MKKTIAPKPKFHIGQALVLTRVGFPGHTKGTAVAVIQVMRGVKRDGYAHRYRVRASSGADLYAYEGDLGTSLD